MIDFTHPAWQTFAQQLLAQDMVSVRDRNLQPLIGLLRSHQLLLSLGAHQYQLTPAGRRYLQRELTLAKLSVAPPSPEEWIHAQGWQLKERVNQRVLAALYRKDEQPFSTAEQIDFEDKGISLCGDGLLRLRASHPFSLFLQGGQLLDAAPWLQGLGEISLPERSLARLGKLIWPGQEPVRVITTDSLGIFTELVMPKDSILVWGDREAPHLLMPLLAALPLGVSWHHITSLDPAGAARVQALAARIARPASWWLPRDLAPFMTHYGSPLAGARAWEPSVLPRAFRSACHLLIAARQGLSAEAMALASSWDAVSG
ncbi:hypothetical protein [Aeromonas molluscorum]|uniref:Wadjet protein JetD C-terminal domain-containing protein n=1 Tax=Aeromonas molluscorum 848 TaxID=1268236 RepID=R1F7D3_9GAMM|nr:hypothetical protein [Aeromonas molluscorum]EOD55647.1 hypothetical protein G113_07875 [Aeromonas molluscorum 848]